MWIEHLPLTVYGAAKGACACVCIRIYANAVLFCFLGQCRFSAASQRAHIPVSVWGITFQDRLHILLVKAADCKCTGHHITLRRQGKGFNFIEWLAVGRCPARHRLCLRSRVIVCQMLFCPSFQKNIVALCNRQRQVGKLAQQLFGLPVVFVLVCARNDLGWVQTDVGNTTGFGACSKMMHCRQRQCFLMKSVNRQQYFVHTGGL